MVSVNAHTAVLRVWLPIAMRCIRNSRSRCMLTSSFWRLIETLVINEILQVPVRKYSRLHGQQREGFYCIVSIHLYSASCSAHQSEALNLLYGHWSAMVLFLLKWLDLSSPVKLLGHFSGLLRKVWTYKMLFYWMQPSISQGRVQTFVCIWWLVMKFYEKTRLPHQCVGVCVCGCACV